MSEQARFDLGDVAQVKRRRAWARAGRVYLSSGIVLGGELHRFRLWRIWGPGPRALWVMLNPSTATAVKGTAEDDDPTITTCVEFSMLWGCGGMEVVNAFAFKATDPKKLYEAEEPIGTENDGHIRAAVMQLAPPAGWTGTGVWSSGDPGGPVVAAWGNHGLFRDRDREVMRILAGAGAAPKTLGVNKNGTPWHPLYRARTTPLVEYGPIFTTRRAA